MRPSRYLGHAFHVETGILGQTTGRVLYELKKLAVADWDRYDNPFEQKYTLRRKFGHEAAEELFRWLEADGRRRAEQIYGQELAVDIRRHYAGVFHYTVGDHLSVHVDAGIHPADGLRKQVTALLYLSDGEPLELWRGDICSASEPRVHEPVVTITPEQSALVFFENNDYAWHGVAEATKDRWVATVSYLSNRVDEFENQRQRAFFVPRPDEEWSSETYRLRDKRASTQQYGQVYRVGETAAV